MRPNPIASWELRLGRLRIYYDVSTESDEIVNILAVGLKIRERVQIGREVVEL